MINYCLVLPFLLAQMVHVSKCFTIWTDVISIVDVLWHLILHYVFLQECLPRSHFLWPQKRLLLTKFDLNSDLSDAHSVPKYLQLLDVNKIQGPYANAEYIGMWEMFVWGDELTYDYGTELWSGMVGMRCRCGTAGCRGVIGVSGHS